MESTINLQIQKSNFTWYTPGTVKRFQKNCISYLQCEIWLSVQDASCVPVVNGRCNFSYHYQKIHSDKNIYRNCAENLVIAEELKFYKKL